MESTNPWARAARRRARPTALIAVVIALGGAACAADPDGDGTVTVYATTGYLADAVANIAPDARVTTMVGPGGDPHTYQPSTRDIQRLRGADLVLWNGLHLEAQMIAPLHGLGDRQLAVGDLLPSDLLLAWPDSGTDDGAPLHDPHIWNSPVAWSHVVHSIGDRLADIDPERAGYYRDNADRYVARIEQVAAEAGALLATVPDEDRRIVTGHDAFAYFGATYGLEVHATDFVSTEAQLSPTALHALADLVVENRIRVLFRDNQANPQAVTSLREAVRARGHDVVVSDAELYADSLGADPEVDTYLEVFAHNARTIADALVGADR